MLDMRRREFVSLLGGAAAWPLAARAQQASMPVVGFLNHGSPERMGNFLAAFRTGLSEGGFVEGRNVAIEFRWAQFDNDRLSELAADLVRRRVSVIATPVSTPAALAAKAATGTIPIVFGIGTDPVQTGLVASLNRPGGNVTGVSAVNVELTAKRLGLLHELIPRADRFAALVSPNDPNAEAFTSDAQSAAVAIGRGSKSSAPAAIKISTSPLRASCGASYPRSLSVPMQCSWRAAFNSSVYRLRHAVATIYPWREAIEIGGLMSYGSSFTEIFRQVGIYTSRILKGENPADFPVLRASKFEFVINLQTAKTLGIEMPPTLLASADEVIE